MHNFRRSIKYLWPYRKRLAIAMACVLVISVLWGGGLGMLGPGARVLLDEDGLHGWAYTELATDRLQCRLTVTTLAANRQIEPGRQLAMVLATSGVKKEGPSAAAGLAEGLWLVGIYKDDGTYDLVRGDELLRTLALAEANRPIVLRVVDPFATGGSRVELTPGPAKWSARTLGTIIQKIPEPRTAGDKFKVFLGLLVMVLVITYLRDLFRFIQEYLVETAVCRGIIDLRSHTYNVALRLPLTFYSEKGTTDTMSRFVKDTNALARAQVTLFSKTLVEPAKAVAAIVMAFVFSWQITLLAMVTGPVTVLLIRKFGKRMKRASKKALAGWADMLAVLEETLTGIRVVKAYTMEGAERRRFFRANRRLYVQQKRIAKIDAATGPTVEALGITAALGAASLGGYWIFSGQMDPINFLGVMACLAAMFDPVRKLARVVNRFQRAEAAAERIFEVQDREQEKTLRGAPPLAKHSKSIELRDVSFRYPSAAEDALSGVNLTIQAGQIVAIVGPNGCGKTTLVSLIPRLMDPAAGQILIDDRDVSQYSLRSLRGQIAVVTQDSVLFEATIAENIAYGSRRPSEADILAAAKQAFVDEFVRELPDGYETMVGQHGATLSGGQKQRIAIARAIIRDPAILIFDEATSQIDSDSERKIHEAMASFVKGRTTLMIAHRFATVAQAGTIVVMDHGQIIDTGPHEALLVRCELYRHLYETQLGDAGG